MKLRSDIKYLKSNPVKSKPASKIKEPIIQKDQTQNVKDNQPVSKNSAEEKKLESNISNNLNPDNGNSLICQKMDHNNELVNDQQSENIKYHKKEYKEENDRSLSEDFVEISSDESHVIIKIKKNSKYSNAKNLRLQKKQADSSTVTEKDSDTSHHKKTLPNTRYKQLSITDFFKIKKRDINSKETSKNIKKYEKRTENLDSTIFLLQNKNDNKKRLSDANDSQLFNIKKFIEKESLGSEKFENPLILQKDSIDESEPFTDISQTDDDSKTDIPEEIKLNEDEILFDIGNYDINKYLELPLTFLSGNNENENFSEDEIFDAIESLIIQNRENYNQIENYSSLYDSEESLTQPNLYYGLCENSIDGNDIDSMLIENEKDELIHPGSAIDSISDYIENDKLNTDGINESVMSEHVILEDSIIEIGCEIEIEMEHTELEVNQNLIESLNDDIQNSSEFQQSLSDVTEFEINTENDLQAEFLAINCAENDLDTYEILIRNNETTDNENTEKDDIKKNSKDTRADTKYDLRPKFTKINYEAMKIATKPKKKHSNTQKNFKNLGIIKSDDPIQENIIIGNFTVKRSKKITIINE
ncbi:hypothetical protein GVAV_003589 [Gurleya vavrai]